MKDKDVCSGWTVLIKFRLQVEYLTLSVFTKIIANSEKKGKSGRDRLRCV